MSSGKFLIPDGNNAPKTMKKVLKIYLKPQLGDGIKILQNGLKSNPV